MRLTYGEYFSGPGGMSLGAELASDGLVELEHSWAIDYDPDSVSTYNRNIAPVAVVNDVRQVSVDRQSRVDLFAFGFPCNDFSVVGAKLGLEGDYGPLYKTGIRVLEEHQPMAFVAENVGGLASANEGRAFTQILAEMQSAGCGYELTPHLYNAEDYGVPQSRKRILIVGIRSDLEKKFLPPARSSVTPVTVRDALVNEPFPDGISNHEFTKMGKIVIERLKHIRPGENAFTASMPEHLRLNVQGAKISQIYKRLELDRPSYTITGSGGGGTHVYHWEEHRALTNRERARLQSFPDSFVFDGSKESVRKQIGMAVPPLLAKAVFAALFKTLLGICYEAVPQNISFDGRTLRRSKQQVLFEETNVYG